MQGVAGALSSVEGSWKRLGGGSQEQPRPEKSGYHSPALE